MTNKTWAAQNWQQLIDEQKKQRTAKKKKQETHRIQVLKYNPATDREEPTWITTKDHGTFEQMYKKYKDNYPYYCAQLPYGTFPLIPNPKKAAKLWGTTFTNRRGEQQGYTIGQMNPLSTLYYQQNTAWIDQEHNAILVEKAPLNPLNSPSHQPLQASSPSH